MLALFLAPLFLSAAPLPADAPEVWMASANTDSLGEVGAEWPFVMEHLDGLQFQINALAFLAPSPNLDRLVSILKEQGIKTGIEGGYFDWINASQDFSAPNRKGITDTPREDFTGDVGRETALTEMAKIIHLTNAKGVPDYIFLDGPFRRFALPGQDAGRRDIKGITDIPEIIRQIISYMNTWRERFPEIRFVLICNFPNWGWKGQPSYFGTMGYGDYYEYISQALPMLKAAGVPVESIRIDYPYEYAIGAIKEGHSGVDAAKEIGGVNWMGRIRELEDYAREQGLRVELVVNSQTGGNTSPEMFYTETLKYLDAYRAKGGRPNRYVAQTWYLHPKKVWPEAEPFTLTHLTAEVIRRVKEIPAQ